MMFWDRVDAKIKEKGLKQWWVAEKIGLKAKTFNTYIARSGSEPSVSRAYDIAIALDTTIEYLVKGEDGKKHVRSVVEKEGGLFKPPERLRELYALAEQLDDSELLLIVSAAQGLVSKKLPYIVGFCSFRKLQKV